MRQQGKADLYNVAVFTLGRTILLMSMRALHMMLNANSLKEGVQTLILPTPNQFA